MKSTSAALATHLAGPVTTLATCWRISRVDGKEFFFTDHDRDLSFEGTVYKASSGYSRTAIANDASLSVDNLDVEGVFDSEAITEEELRAGLFDQAEVRIFLVNWADPAMGALRMRRGWFGEVVLTEQGVFRTELRGMTQALQQRIGELYSPECRADLGDHRCRVPIAPPVVARSTAYAAGDTVRVNTLRPSVPLALVNAGLDTGDLSGWTTLSGAAAVKTSDGIGPQAGTHFLEGANPSTAGFAVEQVVDMSAALDLAAVDAGGYVFDFACWRANSAGDANDQGRVLVELLDAADAALAVALDTGAEAISPVSTWVARSVTGAAVPAGTRKVRVTLTGAFVSGSVTNAAFDSLSGLFRAPEVTQEFYENRIYKCAAAGTTAAAQPFYNPTVGQQTTDGTAVFEAEEAWTRHGAVTAVVDRTTFDIAIDEPRAADGWFAGGVLTWESGANAGRSCEVRDWVEASSRITLFLPQPFAIEVGDKFRAYPGCDKRLSTCTGRFANVLNFRGEPHLPGQDAMLSYPDAK